MTLLQNISRKKSDFNLFLIRNQTKKINYIHICQNIITEKKSFQNSLIDLHGFLQVVEIINGRNKITIDNKFGKFIAVWNEEGKNLIDYEFRARRDAF